MSGGINIDLSGRPVGDNQRRLRAALFLLIALYQALLTPFVQAIFPFWTLAEEVCSNKLKCRQSSIKRVDVFVGMGGT